MEAGYRGQGPSKGYFPQVSGFRIWVDRKRPDLKRNNVRAATTVDLPNRVCENLQQNSHEARARVSFRW